MEHPRFHNQKEADTKERFKTLGWLGLTAEDHVISGSNGMPELLLKNPGKTLGELMSDEEILNWIKGEKDSLIEYFEKLRNPGSSFEKFHLPEITYRFKASLEYLKHIGRLPKEFEDFDPEAFLEEKLNQ